MRSFFTNVRAGLIGIAIACAAVALFAVLSGFTLSDARIAEVAKTAFAKNELAYAELREDFFTECALLQMQALRQPGVFWNALDTRFVMPPDAHPCDTLRVLALGTVEQKASLPASVSYFNYPFGSRHLQAFVLSVLNYAPATMLYRALSYGSVALLFATMLWRSPATAILLAPIPLFLIGAFALHRFGGNLSHAPGYFVGFAALAIFVALPHVFDAAAARRLGFAGAVGVIAAYFDLLNGVIVTLLALTILLNHFFYVAAERHRPDYLFKAASEALAILACFLAAFWFVTFGRLGLLWLNGVDITRFTANLAVRTAQDIGIPLTFRQNLETLFAIRSQLTPDGAGTANWVFLAGIAGWIFAGLAGLAVLVLRRGLRIPALVDVLVLAAVSLGVLAWYRCFTGHTFVHAAFMVRLLAIPLACGLAAALLTAREERDRLPAFVVPGAACLALGLAALLLHSRWIVGTATAARFIEAPADLVSCGPLGLKPDGRADGVVEIDFEKVTPPLASLGLKVTRDTAVQLTRRSPDAAYHTGAFHNIVGIAMEAGGSLRNRPDGGFRFAGGTEPRIFAHFCREGAEPRSRYELIVDGVRTPILP
ncbi:MAG: hypothetical protein WCE79_10220 [Xanthobacteraceae bacterium]